MNKKILIVVLAAIVMLAVGYYFVLKGDRGGAIEKTPPGKNTLNDAMMDEGMIQSDDLAVITITDKEGFSPKILNIKLGQAVMFQNDGEQQHWPASAIHPTHEVYPEFDPLEAVLPEESWLFEFDEKGSWRYHDHLNSQFTGIINVE